MRLIFYKVDTDGPYEAIAYENTGTIMLRERLNGMWAKRELARWFNVFVVSDTEHWWTACFNGDGILTKSWRIAKEDVPNEILLKAMLLRN